MAHVWPSASYLISLSLSCLGFKNEEENTESMALLLASNKLMYVKSLVQMLARVVGAQRMVKIGIMGLCVLYVYVVHTPRFQRVSELVCCTQ